MIKTIKAEEDDAGKRLDVFLTEKLPDQSRNSVQKLLSDNCVLLSGNPTEKKRRVTAGEEYSVNIPEPVEYHAMPQDIPLDIVYEDKDLIVVNKPVGMVVHPAAGHWEGTLVNALLNHCGDSLSGINGELRPGIVHRIDRDTSGLIVAAKNDCTHRDLAAQLQDHTMYRVYEAVLIGTPKPEEGTVDAPIGRHPADRKKMAVTQRNSRRAVTHYKVLVRYRGFSLVECRLETGRTHQIRVHMAHIGHPVAGDPIYGPKKNVFGLSGQCLHAKTLSFIHPGTGERVEFSAPRPDWFEKVLTKLETDYII